MCTKYLKVKSDSYASVKYAFVPCGKCADCRKVNQNAWTWRLLSEFYTAKKRGWNVGFITLTYMEEYLPHVPCCCFKNPLEYEKIPCFSREHVRGWIDDVRQFFKYHRGFKNEKNIRYFVCSELGSHTHRPHYHALLAWSPEVSYECMFGICKHYWKYGLVGPKFYNGDSKNLPFEVVGDCSKVLQYVSKYVSKDIDFQDITRNYKFYDKLSDYPDEENQVVERDKVRIFKRCQPFHIQSRSFGYEPIKYLTNEEKLHVLQHGMSVVGSDKVWQVPLYIRNKICFDNYYIVDDSGKRLCRRRSSAFFEKYKHEIYEQKIDFYKNYLGQMNREYLLKSGVSPETAAQCSNVLNDLRLSLPFADLDIQARYYLAYNAIDYNACYEIDLADQWLNRYRKPKDVARRAKRKMWSLIPEDVWLGYRTYWVYLGLCYTLCGVAKLGDREKQDRLIKKIQDFFNNVI